MSKPSRRFCARPYALYATLRDVVLAGVVARVESLPVLTLLIRAGTDGQVRSAGPH
jgi:hypothetical protein